MSEAPADRRPGLARLSERALFSGAALAGAVVALLGLAACDYVIADRVGVLPQAQAWDALPVRPFLTRPTVRLEALEMCRRARCGYDAVIARVTASGSEAAALDASLRRPDMLARLIAHEPAIPGVTRRAIPARVAAAAFDDGGWRGVSIDIANEARQAHGIVLEAPGTAGRYLVVVTPDAALSRRLAAAAH